MCLLKLSENKNNKIKWKIKEFLGRSSGRGWVTLAKKTHVDPEITLFIF